MNREDIIRMAREADLIYWHPNSTFSDGVWWMDAGEPGDELERFAALVAAAAKAEEREECAKVCDAAVPQHERFDDQRGAGNITRRIAAAIRARGQS